MSFWPKELVKKIWNMLAGLPKKIRSVLNRDRHVADKTALTSAKRVFSRRFYYLGAVYLVVIVVLLSVAVQRLGLKTAPEFPGLDKEWTGSRSEEHSGEALQTEPGSVLAVEEPSPYGSGESEPGTGQEEDLSGGNSGEDNRENPDFETAGFSTDEAAETGDSDFVFHPASPLPHWYLHKAYGCYISDALPSGGTLHYRARGALLAGTPGAPVSALWDGTVVSAAAGENFPYGYFVVVEHGDGYSSLYGNLREVWVQEGDQVNRGENLGVLSHAPPARNSITVGSSATAVHSTGILPFRTISSGFEESGDSNFLEGLQKEIDREAGGQVLEALGTSSGINGTENYSAAGNGEEEGSVLMSSSFDGENPLLYLELRKDNCYMDPLLFIHDRN